MEGISCGVARGFVGGAGFWEARLATPPLPRRRAPAELGAANGPDKIAHRIRNDESFSEHGGAAERSEAAYVAPSPLLAKQKGDGAT